MVIRGANNPLCTGNIHWALDAGVDVGGTFTDFVLLRGESIEAFKLPSTPRNPEEVLLRGLDGRDLEAIGHGTTLATNAALEGKGAVTALVTTAGFEDLLVIGRQNRPRLYDFRATRPEAPVPRERTFGVKERVGPTGEVIGPLSREEVAALAEELESLGVESVAVSLLFSFLNPKHEQLVDEVLRPRFNVSLSSEVLPEFREYERTSTTVMDALVGPLVRGYLSRLRDRLGARLFIMRSNGGLREAESLQRRPVEMVLSGPAGGVAGSKFLAGTLGLENIMALDMGGTSTDISLLISGQATWTTESQVGGHPLALPVLDISTIGAGGGSIAWIDEGGALRVGPRSAGAEPGPMCYALGGGETTLTDVDLLSGILGEALLGGEMPLDRTLSEKGAHKLARRLALGQDELLSGVRQVVVSNMVRAASLSFAKRGLDPREFSLVAFGGAGPMHAVDVARELGMRQVVVPPIPGAFSAYGILLSDLRLDYGRSLPRSLEGSGEELETIWRSMEDEAEEELQLQSYRVEDALMTRSLDLRYKGQSYEINVPLTQEVETEFHRLHEARFGYSIPDEPVEVVNVRLTALVERPKPTPRLQAAPSAEPASRRVLMRDGWEDVPVYQRWSLPPDFQSEGSLIVEEQTATTMLDRATHVKVDGHGCLRVEVD